MDLRERGPQATRSAAGVERHPWECARLRLVRALLAGVPLGHVLDVGAGDAWLIRALVDEDVHATALAVDAHYTDEDLRVAAPRIHRARAMSVVAPLEHALFDTALLLDVLEHVDDDDALLRDVVACVRPGGRVVVTVPAWPQLFSDHDRMLLHRRRYHPVNARALLGRAGLTIERAGGVFFSLLAPRAVSRLLEGAGVDRSPRGLGAAPTGLAREAMQRILNTDVTVALQLAERGVEVPGLSWFALCTRGP